ncbi:MAG TPA: hypothetical protein VFA23_04060 [Dongiaceae bacterium]|nr:hypothetical protein [Dongiaceae bacterium]
MGRAERIAIGPLIGRSYAHPLRHWTLFLWIAWPWLALTVLIGLLVPRLPLGRAAPYVGELFDIPLVVAFAVAWHRATLVGEVPKGWVGGRFGRRELRYAGWVALLMAGSFGVMVLAALLATALMGVEPGPGQIALVLIALAGVVYLATRLILLLPAAALGDRNAGLGWSWRLTRGHGLALFLGFCAASLPLLLLKYVLVLASGEPAAGSLAALLAQAVRRLFDFANMAVSIAFMSFVYQAFTRP